MSSDKVVLMPAISYTVANAKKDIGNIEINLSNYVKKETLEIIIESLVSDEELAEKLKDYVNKVFMNNALDDYVTKVLLNEKINNFTTYTYVQDVIDNVSTITDQMLAIETTLTNKSDIGHTHTTADITDMGTSITTKTLNTNHISLTNNTNDLWLRAIETYAPNLTNGNHVVINIGKKNSKGLSAHIGYKYSSTESECGVVFGLYSYGDIVTITNNKLTSTVPIEASNIKTDNETRLATVETSLTNKADVEHTHPTTDINDLETLIETKINEAKETIINEAFKEIYPIGSIYVSTSLLSENVNYDYNLSEYYVLWHGCKWKFMDQEFFLRNSTFNVEYGRDETISFIGVGDKGYVSVTDSLTNSYPYLSVCMYQRIA